MRLLISGNGRTCSNWLLSSMAGTGLFDKGLYSEDRALPRRRELKEKYIGKLCIENKGVDKGLFKSLITKYDDLRIMWCIRHPVATAMAKIERGSNAEGVPKAVDARPESACEWVEKSYSIMEYILSGTYRIVGVKQESLIKEGDKTIKYLFAWMGITGHDDDYCHRILMNFKDTPNKHHLKRYGDKIDETQAHIHENPETAYDGFFKDRMDDIEYIQTRLDPLVEKYYG